MNTFPNLSEEGENLADITYYTKKSLLDGNASGKTPNREKDYR